MDLTSTDSIRLTVPGTAAAVRIARAGAAGLATRAGFTYHEVEQVTLAVGEAAALFATEPEPEPATVDGAAGDTGTGPAVQGPGRGSTAPDRDDGTLGLTFDVDSEGLRVEMRLLDVRDDTRALAAPLPEVSTAVLDASVDLWRVHDDRRGLVLHKVLPDVDPDDED